MSETLMKLPYAYAALEPYIDAKTMEIHHSKHHQAYVNNYNNAIKGRADLEAKSVEDVLKNLEAVPAEIRGAVRNHGGGVVNHNIFWSLLANAPDGRPVGKSGEAIMKEFGTLEAFKEKFTQAGATQFGSGWAWLVVGKDKKLKVYNLPNQDSPLSAGDAPVLTVDVWEHAYYLHYQNRRPDYLTAFWNVINWKEVERRYTEALR